MKKGDIIIAVCVLAAALIAFSALLIISFGKSQKIVITKNNDIIYEGKLSENKTINLDTNVLQIKNGKVKMTYGDCKNQVCVNHKEISRKGETIVCLPNKIIVEIK